MKMKTPIESLVAAVSAVMEERAAQERVFEAVKIVHGSEPCGCVKDMPGDNSTCWAHQVLRDFARGGGGEPGPDLGFGATFLEAYATGIWKSKAQLLAEERKQHV